MMRALSVKTIDLPSGDQLRPPTARSPAPTTTDSLPSASDRTIRSPPPAAPRPPRPVAGAAAGAEVDARTNATRDESGEGVMFDWVCGVVHTADGLPPLTGICQRSPWRGK